MKRPKTFSVKGSGLFPFDMLRYDCAYPASEADSAIIEATTRRGAHQSRWEVELRTQNEFGPTPGRWESFGWKVLP